MPSSGFPTRSGDTPVHQTAKPEPGISSPSPPSPQPTRPADLSFSSPFTLQPLPPASPSPVTSTTFLLAETTATLPSSLSAASPPPFKPSPHCRQAELCRTQHRGGPRCPLLTARPWLPLPCLSLKSLLSYLPLLPAWRLTIRDATAPCPSSTWPSPGRPPHLPRSCCPSMSG